MRWLIVGAGALGGYFGGRLLQAGQDVTFLLRERRMAQIKAAGLVIKSPLGDAHIAQPPCVSANDIDGPYDIVVVSCKAYDLDQAMESFAPAVGPGTAILPLLNGMRHLDQLAARFGEQHVLGGLCMISAALDASGAIVHFNDAHSIVFGEQDGSSSERFQAIKAAFAPVNAKAHASTKILQEMWEKWVFIAAAAGITCLMRAAIGDIIKAGAGGFSSAILDECASIAAANGFPVRPASLDRFTAMLTAADSLLTASMLKDIERGAPTEGEHILGELLHRAKAGQRSYPVLEMAYAHLNTYEVRRARQA